MQQDDDPDARFIELFEKTSEFDPGHRKYPAYRSFNMSAVDRGRRIVGRLREEMDLDGIRALDIGTGSGGIAIALAEAGASVDASEPDSVRFQWARERVAGHGVPVRLCKAAGENLPFDDASMELVILDSVIEHVDDPALVVAEVGRVLRPGGVVYLVSPNKMSVFNIVRDPHYEMFGVVLLPRSLGRFYVERVRRDRRGYWVNVTPTKRWLLRHFERAGVELKQLRPDGFDKLTMPGAPFRGPRLVRLVARAAVSLGLRACLERAALAQYPAFIMLGRRASQ
jgi:ubiquinone/menaquinone biosynthesis C-methylase UbiE